MRHPTQSQAGFSFVELLIVVTLTVILVVSASSLLLVTLLSNSRINTVKEIKQSGDHAMAQMTTLLRNAIKLVPNDAGQTCSYGMSQIRFISLDEGTTTLGRATLSATDARVASGSGTTYMTSDTVYLSGIQFDCAQSSDGSITTVKVSFTLQKGQTGVGRVTDIGSQTFVSSAAIRSF